MADAEDNDKARLVVLEDFFGTRAEESDETKLAVPEELAEDEPRFMVLRNPVGADSVMYATDEAFVKATT